MPDALMSHASMSDTAAAQSADARQHGAGEPKQTSIDEALTPKRTKRSYDYLWKSGVSGGFAGCAVSTHRGRPCSSH